MSRSSNLSLLILLLTLLFLFFFLKRSLRFLESSLLLGLLNEVSVKGGLPVVETERRDEGVVTEATTSDKVVLEMTLLTRFLFLRLKSTAFGGGGGWDLRLWLLKKLGLFRPKRPFLMATFPVLSFSFVVVVTDVIVGSTISSSSSVGPATVVASAPSLNA